MRVMGVSWSDRSGAWCRTGFGNGLIVTKTVEQAFEQETDLGLRRFDFLNALWMVGTSGRISRLNRGWKTGGSFRRTRCGG